MNGSGRDFLPSSLAEPAVEELGDCFVMGLVVLVHEVSSRAMMARKAPSGDFLEALPPLSRSSRRFV